MSHETLEKKIEQNVNTYFRKLEALCQKVKFVESGFPDRFYVLPNGLSVWLEYKRKGEYPSNLQDYRMAQLRINLQLVGWTDEFSSAITFIKNFMDSARISKESYYAVTEPSIRRPIPRSWARENLYLPRILENIERKEIRREMSNCSAP